MTNSKELQKKKGVTLILPTKNELEGLKWFMPQLKKEWYDQLIIIDANSQDGTKEYCNANNYPYYTQHSGRGVAAALMDAFELVEYDIVLTLSPDGNSLPRLIPELTQKIREGYDLAVASRYLAGAKSEDDDCFTSMGNRFFTGLINLLFGSNYTDTLVIYRAFKAQAIVDMRLNHQPKRNWYQRHFLAYGGWDLTSSARAAKLKLKVISIPGDEPKRIGGQRKLSIVKNGLTCLIEIFYEFFVGKKIFK